MEILLAPLEGITSSVYRQVFDRHFPGIDRFFTPFISANETHKFRSREKREVIPYNKKLVPQLIANDPDDFCYAALSLANLGYKEVNLNMGCPSGTVVKKNKGAGMLSDIGLLKIFFDKVFEKASSYSDFPDISVKTRIGLNDTSCSDSLIKLLSSYDFSEIIVHPRCAAEFYKGPVHMDIYSEFEEVFAGQKRPLLTYNGEIKTVDDFNDLCSDHPGTTSVMIGRGLISDPSLARQIRGGERFNNRELKSFLDELKDTYLEIYGGQKQLLDKMKEIWTYLAVNFPEKKKAVKNLKKASSIPEYNAYVTEILQ
ncbi:MAG: tRNA-dihydrouridine synthase family protein [Lachnospiraceae bacterium]|nr:tRNA-dihydrouridine synthase family protein [Lachnospiraceae bacterium]